MGSRSTISGLEEGSSETFMVMAEMNEIKKKKKDIKKQIKKIGICLQYLPNR